MDRVLLILAGITKPNGYNTDVQTVTEQIRQYNEFKPKQLPVLAPMDLDEDREMVAFPTGSSYSQMGTLNLRISAAIYDGKNDTRTARLNLMQDVEKALCNDATLDALGVIINPTSVVTDDGQIRFYSVWDQYFEVTYYYDRSDGG